MLIGADYPFLSILWTMIVFFAFVIWIWLAVSVFVDVFRRADIGGWGKAGWILLVVVLPYLGVFIYLIAEHDGMRERGIKQAESDRAAFDRYVREAAGGSAAEIARAKDLLDEGAITQAEFDAIKATALT